MALLRSISDAHREALVISTESHAGNISFVHLLDLMQHALAPLLDILVHSLNSWLTVLSNCWLDRILLLLDKFILFDSIEVNVDMMLLILIVLEVPKLYSHSN